MHIKDMYDKADWKTRVERLAKDWKENPRWKGIIRPYSPEEVIRLRGSYDFSYPIAERGARKLWEALNTRPWVAGLGALTGLQAVQEVEAGLPSIYVSGWQVAADANVAGHTYPDQSLYPVESVPALVRRINNALLRADQIEYMHAPETGTKRDWLVPIVADAEAGFGGNLNAFELMKMMIEAGAAGVHFEDQLSSAKKCGHLGGKVLVPTSEAIQKLIAARLAADVMGVPTVLIARTDANSATLLTSDIDPADEPFILRDRKRSSEGFYYIRSGLEMAIARGLAYAPYADLLWCETSTPDLGEAREFAQAIHEKFPGKLLAYNCSPSFNWKKHLSYEEMATFREKLAEMGYKYQFITLAGFHALNLSMFELAKAYMEKGMAGYSELQEQEFAMQAHGFRAVKHQAFVGTEYFDAVQLTITAGQSALIAMEGSTEKAQF
ncbi:MAG: isocitrate lyase [Bacteroidia bacterium]|nr:isocitrate lyase [Bacteroidia bacterium]MCX7763990.1 isocitrate lyase [Bacteroidia bacterium]MDW8056878.1 isocitrate lyase [Bacteroidia bacterium]